MDHLGKIRRFHWKERLKTGKIAKFEGATSYKRAKISVKIAPQSYENLQMFVWWGERTCHVESWKKTLWKGLPPLLLIRRIQPKYFQKFCKLIDYEVITITSTARDTAKEQSKSTTLHCCHALLYISSPSGFPFRKRSLPFFRTLLETQECFH